MAWFRKKNVPNPTSKVVFSQRKKTKVLKRTARRGRGMDDVEKVGRGWKQVYVGLWMFFGGVCGYILIFSSFLSVQNVEVEGLKEVPREEVRQFVDDLMRERRLGFLPGNNLFVMYFSDWENRLRERFQKIRAARVKMVFPHSLMLSAEERQTLLVWCSGGPCFYIDELGYAYQGADVSSEEQGESALLRIVDVSAQPLNLQEPFLEREFLEFALRAEEELREMFGVELMREGFTPSRLSSELRLKTQEDWELYLDTDLPLEKSLQTLNLLFQKEISAQDRARLRYIDLRADNRVYYVLNSDEEAIESSEESASEPAATASSDASKKVSDEDKEEEKKKKKQK
jgi:cell division septal protein FtsQ